MDTYIRGEPIELTITFVKTSTQVPTDPASWILTVGNDPENPVQTLTYGVASQLTKITTGIYLAELDSTPYAPAGLWYAQPFAPPGPSGVQAVGDYLFMMVEPALPLP